MKGKAPVVYSLSKRKKITNDELISQLMKLMLSLGRFPSLDDLRTAAAAGLCEPYTTFYSRFSCGVEGLREVFENREDCSPEEFIKKNQEHKPEEGSVK